MWFSQFLNSLLLWYLLLIFLPASMKLLPNSKNPSNNPLQMFACEESASSLALSTLFPAGVMYLQKRVSSPLKMQECRCVLVSQHWSWCSTLYIQLELFNVKHLQLAGSLSICSIFEMAIVFWLNCSCKLFYLLYNSSIPTRSQTSIYFCRWHYFLWLQIRVVT